MDRLREEHAALGAAGGGPSGPGAAVHPRIVRGHLARARLAIVLVMRGSGAGFDEGRLAQSVMLAAWAHGVGSCIGSIYPEENEHSARDLLGVPEDRAVRTAISLGYPANLQARRLSGSPADVRAAVLWVARPSMN